MSKLPSAIYVWIVPSEEVLEQSGSWRIRKWDIEPFPEANFALPKTVEPVAYVIQSDSDGSIRDEIAPVRWSTFEKKMEKFRNEPWVKNGAARIVPLYAALQASTGNGNSESRHARVRALFEALSRRDKSVGPSDWDCMSEEDRDKMAAAIDEAFPVSDRVDKSHYEGIDNLAALMVKDDGMAVDICSPGNHGGRGDDAKKWLVTLMPADHNNIREFFGATLSEAIRQATL